MAMDFDEKSLIFEFEKALAELEFQRTQQMLDDDEPQLPGEVCKFFLKGTCSKGMSCPYKHEKKGERAVVCKHWLRGLCKKGDACEFLHEYDLSKMPECYFYSKFGECSNPECLYLHINPEDKVKECPWYARGFCKHGPRCRHKHMKRPACLNYLLGFCPDGMQCRYGHPKYELPKEGDEAKDKRPRTPMICHKCGSVGHKAASCPFVQSKEPGKDGRAAPRPLETVTCFKCGQLGHYANHCNNKPNPKVQNQMHSQLQRLPVQQVH